ncbi:MAG: hypothetical protein HY695_04970 [Deltaproteobacteria bacterium]|nr:hypothetical protein [Deltaproteobacteria bacterium]
MHFASLLLLVSTILLASAAVLVSQVSPAANKQNGPFEWEKIPPNIWLRLETTGTPPRKVFHGASAIAPDRDEVFFFGADTHDTDYNNTVSRLNLKTLEWSQDYIPDPITDYALTSDGYAVTKSGRPWAMHTFDCWDYDPVARKLVAVGSPEHAAVAIAQLQQKGLLTAKPRAVTWLYDPDEKSWTLIRTNSPRLFAFALVWNPVHNEFIGHDGLATYHYDPKIKNWITRQAPSVPGWHRKMVFDTFASLVLTLGNDKGSDVLYSYDPNSFKWEVVKVNGKTLPGNGAALAYDTHNHVMLYLANDYHNQYDNPSGKSVTFIYESKTKTWKRLNVQSPDVYGMNYLTQYDPIHRVFLHFEKARDSGERLAVWTFRYQPK